MKRSEENNGRLDGEGDRSLRAASLLLLLLCVAVGCLLVVSSGVMANTPPVGVFYLGTTGICFT